MQLNIAVGTTLFYVLFLVILWGSCHLLPIASLLHVFPRPLTKSLLQSVSSWSFYLQWPLFPDLAVVSSSFYFIFIPFILSPGSLNSKLPEGSACVCFDQSSTCLIEHIENLLFISETNYLFWFLFLLNTLLGYFPNNTLSLLNRIYFIYFW